jgi:hypothetical protein
MKVRISMIATVALAAACHGGGPATDPNSNGSTIGNPGLYFRAVPLLAPSTEKSTHACAGTATRATSCRADR